MIFYREYAPAASLRSYIECYWVFRTQTGTNWRDLVIADCGTELIFNCGRAFRRSPVTGPDAAAQECKGSLLLGLRTSAYWVDQPDRMDYVSVRFLPGGLRRFLRVPAAELTDQRVGAELIFGRQASAIEDRL